MAYKYQSGAAQMSGALTQEGHFYLHNESGDEVASVKQSGVVSGSAAGKFSTLSIDSVQVFSDAQQLQNVASLDATSEATIESAIDTLANLASMGASGNELEALGVLDVAEGIKVANSEVISSARAVSNITSVDGSGDLTMGTITMTGFSVDADGDTALKSLAVDNSSTIGCDADADIMTLAAQSLALANDVDFNVAKAGGLQLGGVAVTSTAAELNLVDGITAGTVAASKAVIVDSNKDISGFRNVTATGYFEIGSAQLTESEMEMLDGITAGTVAASKAVVVDANKDASGFRSLTASANIVADKFFGNGAGLTNVDAVTAVTSSTANVQYELAFTEYLGTDVELGGNAGLSYNPTGRELFLSGTNSGMQSFDIVFGNSSSKQGQLLVEEDDGYLFVMKSDGAIDISGSDGVTSMVGVGTNFTVASAYTSTGLVLSNMNGDLAVDIGHDGAISGSSNISGGGTLTIAGNSDLNGNIDVAGTTVLGSTLTAAGLGTATVDLTADMMIINDGAGGVIKNTSLANYATALAAGSNEGLKSTAGRLQVDLDDLSEAAVAAADYFAFMDADGSNATKKDSVADLATLFAGNGLAASSAVIGLDLNELSAAAIADGDFLAFVDATDNSTKKEAVADLASLFAGAGLAAASSVIGIANATNGGIGVQANDIKVDLNDLAAGAVSVANDSIAIVDADDSNKSKKESIADLVSAMAGAGLTATNGVLSADAAAAPNAIGDAAATLSEGFNYGSADLTSARVWSLPAPQELGDIVHVKAPGNCSSTLKITIDGGTIDGETSVILESPYAAVSLICVNVGSDLWRLY